MEASVISNHQTGVEPEKTEEKEEKRRKEEETIERENNILNIPYTSITFSMRNPTFYISTN